MDLSSLVTRPVGSRWEPYFAVSPFRLLGKNLDWARIKKTVGRARPFPAHGYVVVQDERPPVRVSDLNKAIELAEAACMDSARNVYLGEARFIVGNDVVFKGMEVLRIAQPELTVDSIDVLIQHLCKDATLDPGNPYNWHIMVRRTADAMQAAASGWEKRATKAARSYIDQNWPRMAQPEIRRAITAASKEIKAIGMKAAPGISKVVSVEAKRIMEGRRKAAIRQFELNIGSNLSLADSRAIEAQRATSVSWITNEYGKRAIQFEGQAKQIVERGLEIGWGRNEIADKLEQRFASQAINRSRSYYQVYAGALVSRSRSYAEVNAYIDASIEKCIAVAVMDDVTTDFCRFVDGKVLDVRQLKSILSGADKPGLSPDSMKAINPWVREQTLPNGSRMMHVGGMRIANIRLSGLGTTRSGEYSNAIGTDVMGALGVGPPPYHGRCRTTTIPEISRISRQVTVQQPVSTPSKLPRKPVPNKAKPSLIDKYGYDDYTREAIIKNKRYMKDPVSPLKRDYDLDYFKKAIIDADSTIMRQQMNAMCAREGLPCSDLIRNAKERTELRIEKIKSGLWGTHSTETGKIKIDNVPWKYTQSYCQGKSKALKGISTMIHEAAHGHSPIGLFGYSGAGVPLEEATNEIVTRYMVKKYVDKNFKKTSGAYSGFINKLGDQWRIALNQVTSTTMPKKEKLIWDSIERSCLNYKKTAMGKDSGLTSSVDQLFGRFRNSIEISDELLAGVKVKDRPKIVEYLKDTISKGIRSRWEGGQFSYAKPPSFGKAAPAPRPRPKRATVKVPKKTETPSMPVDKPLPKLPDDLPSHYMTDKTAPGAWKLDDLRKAMEAKDKVAVRKHLNSLYSQYGMTNKDILWNQPGRVKINFKSVGGAAGAHGLDGQLYISRKTWTDALKFLNGGDIKNAQAFGTLLHEAFHAHTPATLYRGIGMNIEEMITELGTRQAMRDMFGASVAGTRVSYSPQIEAAIQAFRAVDPALDVDEIMTMAGKAAINACRGTQALPHEMYLRTFADGVEFPAKWTNGLSKAKASAKINGARDTLYKELSERLATVQPPK